MAISRVLLSRFSYLSYRVSSISRLVSSLSVESMSWGLVPLASAFVISSASDYTTPSPTTRLPLFHMKCCFSSHSASAAGIWLERKKRTKLPPIVKAGEPVLHERAQEVNTEEIKSERVQKIIDDMIHVMRKAPGVGLAAPQIGIPLRIIVLEDREEYLSLYTKEEIEAHDRRPFDLLVILNPKLEKKSNRTALFFEGCLSVKGFTGVVERWLEVEVSGFDRNGEPIKINASGWQARILQHECDHLDGTLYVDKMVSRTFRTEENFDLPLAHGCPKLGPR